MTPETYAFADDDALAVMRTLGPRRLTVVMHYAGAACMGVNASIAVAGVGSHFFTRAFPDLGSLRGYLLERLPGTAIDVCCACFDQGRRH